METKAKIIIGDSRQMKELKDEEIDLITTSPPYWHIKDYGILGQIGYGLGCTPDKVYMNI